MNTARVKVNETKLWRKLRLCKGMFTKSNLEIATSLEKLLLRHNQNNVCRVICEMRHKFVTFAAFYAP